MVDHMSRQEKMRNLQGFTYKKASFWMLVVFVVVPAILIAAPYLAIGFLFLVKLILKSGL